MSTTSITLEVHSDDPRMVELLQDYRKWDLKLQYEMQVLIHQFEAARLSRMIGRMEMPHRGGGRKKADG